MDKNAIKKYAVWARGELIKRVSQKALQYGITADSKADPNADSVHGRLLTDAEKKQRGTLISKVNEHGYEQVIEEVAYTWFNRFAALRFMEVNGYLPSYVRVFTNDAGEFKPQILSEAIHLDLDGIDMDKVYELKNANKDEELFKYLLIVQCNALNKILPGMFQHIEDFTELLLPDYLLREGSVINKMIDLIPEENWRDQVQIIGWLYQYYNTEPKDKVFAGLKKNVKITRENIPAATQLFTPDWIVRYMVENSLGRLWLEGHPNDALKSQWKYYLNEAEQEDEVQAQLDAIRREYADLKPEDIKCIDPCMGSGHILCYLFDVLMQIYESQGYSQRDATQSILRHNLYGLDIDKRAAQLSYFAVMMKARQYDRRFLSRNLQPKVYSTTGDEEGEKYGSLVTVENPGEMPEDPQSLLEQADYEERLNAWSYRYLLAQKYHVVVTNPPYMGASNMNGKLSEFVKGNFPDSKADLFSCFIERGNLMIKRNGYNCMVTMQSWMFLSSFEKMRIKIMQSRDIAALMHMENMVMGIAFGTAVTVFRNGHISGYKGTYNYVKLENIERGKPKEFPVPGNRFAQVSTDNFSKIPGSPVAYWVSETIYDTYINYPSLGTIAAPRKGNSTSDNNRFLRLWFEVNAKKINLHCKKICREDTMNKRWFPYNKGGGYRKWYGFNEYLIDWYNDAAAIRSIKTAVIANYQYFMKPGLTWSTLTNGQFSIRWFDEGFIFDNGGCCIFELGKKRPYLCALLNSKVFSYIFGQLNPTLNFQSGEVSKFPVIFRKTYQDNIEQFVHENVYASKEDYDLFETSWDFKRHPLV